MPAGISAGLTSASPSLRPISRSCASMVVLLPAFSFTQSQPVDALSLISSHTYLMLESLHRPVFVGIICHGGRVSSAVCFRTVRRSHPGQYGTLRGGVTQDIGAQNHLSRFTCHEGHLSHESVMSAMHERCITATRRAVGCRRREASRAVGCELKQQTLLFTTHTPQLF